MSLDLPRRGFLIGATALIFSPAIVRADSLMKIKGTSMRMHTMTYWRRELGGVEWWFHEEIFPVPRSDIVVGPAAPGMRLPGVYWWSTPENGGPQGHIVDDDGSIRSDGVGSFMLNACAKGFIPLTRRG